MHFFSIVHCPHESACLHIGQFTIAYTFHYNYIFLNVKIILIIHSLIDSIIILPILGTKVENCKELKDSICLRQKSILSLNPDQFGPFPSFEVLFGLGLTEMVGKGVKMSMLLGAGVEVIVEL